MSRGRVGLDPKESDLIELLRADGARKLAELSPAEARGQLAEQVSERADRAGQKRTIPTAGRETPVRLYRPASAQGALPTLVYLHGGGWVVGELGAAAGRAQALADAAHCLVVTVDYRLAPEDKFPAAVDDVHLAIEWLGEHASELGGDPRRLALLGDSSGGNLAAAASLRARDTDGVHIACQVLACPVLDFEFSSPSIDANAEGYLMERADLRWCWAHYLATEADADNPYASPARAASLAGLPPTLVITAEFDPLRDQAEEFGRRLERDGVDSRLRRYPGVIHAFAERESLDQAAQALDEAASFIGEAWAP